MGFLNSLLGKRDAAPAVPAVGPLEETSREDVPCACGCGRRWVLIRGRLTQHGRVSSFVAMPTKHPGDPIIWLAVGDGPNPTKWACAGSRLQGENVAAGIAGPELTPLAQVISPVLTRAEVLADPATKARLFAAHDELLARHPDLRHVVVPDEGRDFSFRMPDCVFEQPASLRSQRNQQNFAECGERLFVRALLPIPVSDGGELRIGLWVEVPADSFFHLMKIWDQPDVYLGTQLEGTVENALALSGGNVKGAHVTVAPRSADQCLFVVDAEAEWLTRLLDPGVSAADLPALLGEVMNNMKRQARA
jgi:hypothetical protein